MLWGVNRVATLPGNLEKPGIWQLRQKKHGISTIFTCSVVYMGLDK